MLPRMHMKVLTKVILMCLLLLYYSWLTPILSFPIVVGLGLDYDMFLLSRILAFREMGFSDKASVILGLYKSGQTVLLGGLIVAITFGGLMLSSLGKVEVNLH